MPWPSAVECPPVKVLFVILTLSVPLLTPDAWIWSPSVEAKKLPVTLSATGTVTAFMLGSAGGTVAGGMLADRTGRHQRIIGAGLALAALIFFLLGRIALPEPLLLLAVALTGALAGLTTPSRDMLVRAAAPAGAAGKVFGFVYSGLDLGSTLTPVLMGTLLDAGRPEAVFVIIPLAMAASILTATTIRGNPQRPVAAR